MPTPRAVPEDGIVAEQAARPLFQAVAGEIREHLDGDASGHDLDHAWRTFALGVRIAEAEGADTEVVGAAALVHDLHRTMCEPGEYVHPEETVDEVRTILERAGFPAEKIPAVCHAVAVHDEYDYRGDPDRAESLEAETLQDADNLDAIGAVGIARDFAFTALAGNPLWDPTGEEPSGIGHAYDKLVKLKDEMNTATGQRLARERHAFLVEFLERFEREWYGEL